MEPLGLDRRIGREPAVIGGKAIAALHPSAIALRVEARAEMVAGKGEAVGRHPVIGEGERGGDIGGTRARSAVETGLEGIALPAADPLSQVPVGAAAGEREAHYRARCEAIIEPGGAARGARG